MVERWNELMAGYVLGDLDAEEMREWEEILRSRPELAEDIRELRQTVAYVSEEAPAVTPPSDLRGTILNAARATPPAQTQPNQTNLSSLPRAASQPQRVLWLGLGSLAAVALVALLLDDLRLRYQVREAAAVITALEQQLEEAEIAIATAPAPPQVYALAGTVAVSEAAGSIVIAPERQAAIITVQDLPPLPSGQTYRIWGIDPEQAPILYGQFETNADGRLLPQEISLPPEADTANINQFLITAESVTAPPRPQGTLVMQSLS